MNSVKDSPLRAVLLAAALLVQIGAAALAAVSPVQFGTQEPGVGTDSPNVLLVALPLDNMGTATAANVRITGITLTSAARLSPAALPLPLGDMAADETRVLNAQFDSSALASGSKVRMTVVGTYRVGATTYGFSVNRNVTVPRKEPTGSGKPESAPVRVKSVFGGPLYFPMPPPGAGQNSTGGEPNEAGPRPVPIGRNLAVAAIGSPASPLVQPPISIPGDANLDVKATSRFGTGAGGSPIEPSGASAVATVSIRGQTVQREMVLATFNLGAAISDDGGATFSSINIVCGLGFATCDANGVPTAGIIDGGLCCDQVVQYIPAVHRFVWLLQTWPTSWKNGQKKDQFDQDIPPTNNRLRLVIVSPEDLENWHLGRASTWEYIDFTPPDFGGNASAWLDYNDIAVGDHYLYFNTNVMGGAGLTVVRIPLDTLTPSSPNVTSEYVQTGGDHSNLVQRPGDAAFWATHSTTSKLNVYWWPEVDPIPSGHRWYYAEINHSAYKSGTNERTPTVPNWMTLPNSKPPVPGWEYLKGAVRVPYQGLVLPGQPRPADELWISWNAAADTDAGHPQRPHAYVRILKVDASNFTARGEADIWSNDDAYGWAAFDTNQNGEVGVVIGIGGPSREPTSAFGFMNSDGTAATLATMLTSDGAENRYGDYLTIRRAADPALFSTFGYGKTFADPNYPVNLQFDPRYALFGRYCDIHDCNAPPPP